MFNLSVSIIDKEDKKKLAINIKEKIKKEIRGERSMEWGKARGGGELLGWVCM